MSLRVCKCKQEAIAAVVLPSNHEIRLRQQTLSVVRVQDPGSQDQFSLHGNHSPGPERTHRVEGKNCPTV